MKGTENFFVSTAAALLLVCLSVPALSQAFDVASVRPSDSGHGPWFIRELPGGRLRAENAPLINLVLYGFRIRAPQLESLPGWAREDRYSIDAVAPSRVATQDGPALAVAQAAMMQALLRQRFGLRSHWSTRMLPAYDLEIAKGGPKLKAAGPNAQRLPSPMAGAARPEVAGRGPGRLDGTDAPLQSLASALSGATGRLVSDKTGLGGKYDFSLQWAARPELPGPSLLMAVEKQLGLKLTATKEPVRVLVIDHIQIPTPN